MSMVAVASSTPTGGNFLSRSKFIFPEFIYLTDLLPDFLSDLLIVKNLIGRCRTRGEFLPEMSPEVQNSGPTNVQFVFKKSHPSLTCILYTLNSLCDCKSYFAKDDS